MGRGAMKTGLIEPFMLAVLKQNDDGTYSLSESSYPLVALRDESFLDSLDAAWAIIAELKKHQPVIPYVKISVQ